MSNMSFKVYNTFYYYNNNNNCKRTCSDMCITQAHSIIQVIVYTVYSIKKENVLLQKLHSLPTVIANTLVLKCYVAFYSNLLLL